MHDYYYNTIGVKMNEERSNKTLPFLIKQLTYFHKSAGKVLSKSLRFKERINPMRERVRASLEGTIGTSLVLGMAHGAAYVIGGQEFYNNTFKYVEQTCIVGLGAATALYIALKQNDIADILQEHPVWTSGVMSSWVTSMAIAGYHSADHWKEFFSYLK
jgi:hypothetical protein